jgi:hypothetical protein
MSRRFYQVATIADQQVHNVREDWYVIGIEYGEQSILTAVSINLRAVQYSRHITNR